MHPADDDDDEDDNDGDDDTCFPRERKIRSAGHTPCIAGWTSAHSNMIAGLVFGLCLWLAGFESNHLRSVPETKLRCGVSPHPAPCSLFRDAVS